MWYVEVILIFFRNITIDDLVILSSFTGKIRLDDGRLLASSVVLESMCLGTTGMIISPQCLT